MLVIRKSAQLYTITRYVINYDWCKFDGCHVGDTPAPILPIDLEWSKSISNSFRNC